MQDAIGHCVLKAARIVPGGMLVFLSSYSLLDRLSQRWQVWCQGSHKAYTIRPTAGIVVRAHPSATADGHMQPVPCQLHLSDTYVLVSAGAEALS